MLKYVYKNKQYIKVYLKFVCNKFFYDIDCVKSYQKSKNKKLLITKNS